MAQKGTLARRSTSTFPILVVVEGLSGLIRKAEWKGLFLKDDLKEVLMIMTILRCLS